MKLARPALIGATAIALCAALAWWLGTSEAAREAATAPVPGLQSMRVSAGDRQRGGAEANAMRTTSNAPADAFLTPELRHTLEEILFEASRSGDASDPAMLKKRAFALLPRFFPAQYTVRATALLDRYIDYRVALGDIKPPDDPGDPRALRTALDARQKVRERHFTGDEYEALFAQDMQLDQYTLARLEIERNNALSTTQKQAALADTEGTLSEAQRGLRRQAIAQMAVAAQTAALDAKGASDIERFNQRRTSYGEAAATQLAQLDREDRDWQSRLNDYASAAAKPASPGELQQLRQRLFSEHEQLRVNAALAARPQGAAIQ